MCTCVPLPDSHLPYTLILLYYYYYYPQMTARLTLPPPSPPLLPLPQQLGQEHIRGWRSCSGT